MHVWEGPFGGVCIFLEGSITRIRINCKSNYAQIDQKTCRQQACHMPWQGCTIRCSNYATYAFFMAQNCPGTPPSPQWRCVEKMPTVNEEIAGNLCKAGRIFVGVASNLTFPQHTHTHTHGTHTRSICQLSTSIMSTFVGILSTIFEHNYEKRFSHIDRMVPEGGRKSWAEFWGESGACKGGTNRSRTGRDFGFKGCILNALHVTTFDAAPQLLLAPTPPPPPSYLAATLNDCWECACVSVCGKEQNVWWKLQTSKKKMKKKKRKKLVIERKRKRVTPI